MYICSVGDEKFYADKVVSKSNLGVISCRQGIFSWRLVTDNPTTPLTIREEKMCDKYSKKPSSLFEWIKFGELHNIGDFKAILCECETPISSDIMLEIRGDIHARFGKSAFECDNMFSMPFVRFSDDTVYVGFFDMDNNIKIIESPLFDICYNYEEYLETKEIIMSKLTS